MCTITQNCFFTLPPSANATNARQASEEHGAFHKLCNRLKACCVSAQVAGGRGLHALLSAKVALLSAIAGSIAVGSCVLNDFFDYSVDIINEPTKVGHASALKPSHACTG